MSNPLQFTLKDDTVITLNPKVWLYVGPEVKKTKKGVPDWYECDVTLTTGSVTVKGRHAWVVRNLMGAENSAVPRWWPSDSPPGS